MPVGIPWLPAFWVAYEVGRNGTIERRLGEGQSQDGILGGYGIRVSAQLGHLPGTSGGPRTPKGTGGTPSNQVGRGTLQGVRREEKWRQDRTGTHTPSPRTLPPNWATPHSGAVSPLLHRS